MAQSRHGGGCCGASHVWSFPSRADAAWLKQQVDTALRHGRHSNRGGHLIDVMLTDAQLRNWADTLKDAGFEYMTRWRNANSSNYVNLLVYRASKPRADNGIQEIWVSAGTTKKMLDTT